MPRSPQVGQTANHPAPSAVGRSATTVLGCDRRPTQPARTHLAKPRRVSHHVGSGQCRVARLAADRWGHHPRAGEASEGTSRRNPPAPTTHWARHTTATILIELGVDARIIGEIVGHASEEITRHSNMFQVLQLGKRWTALANNSPEHLMARTRKRFSTVS